MNSKKKRSSRVGSGLGSGGKGGSELLVLRL